MHEYYLKMVIRSKTVDPDEVSQELSIMPASINRIGEKHEPFVHKYHEQNVWEYWTDPSLQTELTDQCIQFVDIFYPMKEILKRISTNCEIIIAFIVGEDYYNCSLNIEPDFIELCSFINARLFFDIYLYGEDEIEERKKD